MKKITREKFIEIKEIIVFTVLFIWILMPVCECIDKLYIIFVLDNYKLILMAITGAIGILFGIWFILKKIKEDKIKSKKEILPIFIFLIYMIWTLIACIFSPNKKLAFWGTEYRRDGYLMYIIYAGYFFCAYLLESKELRKMLLNLFTGVSVFLIIMSKISLILLQYTDVFTYSIDSSVFFQFNHYGYYLMMSLMCCFGLLISEKNKILKIVYLALYTLISYALIFNNTFGRYLATSIILIVWCLYTLLKKKDRKITLIAISIFILLSAIVTKDGKNVAFENISSFGGDIKTIITKVLKIDENNPELEEDFEKAGTSRMLLWKNGVKFIKERPIIGYGPENLEEKYASVSIDQDRPHNLLIQLATTSGIPGMILYIVAVGIIVIRGIKNLINNNDTGKIFLIVIVTYLISAMFGNSMYYTSPYYFIFLGFLMNCNRHKQKDKPTEEQ